MPSKLYGIMAAGRIILANSWDGDIVRLVLQHPWGEVIASDDATGLAESLTRLSADPNGTVEWGGGPA